MSSLGWRARPLRLHPIYPQLAPQEPDADDTDIRLPPGMPHGFAMAHMARVRRPDLKVLYMTGYRDIAESEIARASGKMLRKPIRPRIWWRKSV